MNVKMKILHFFLISNFLFAAIGGMTFGIVADASPIMFGMCLIGAAVAIVGLSVVISRQFAAGLRTIEQAVATAQGGQSSKIAELESTRIRLRQYVQRWSVAANRSREQNKVVDWLVETLERRGGLRTSDEATDAGVKLRSILTGITVGADDCLVQIVDAIEQVQTAIAGISRVSQTQSTEVAKLTSHVEQLSQCMAEISAAANKSRESGTSASESVDAVSDVMIDHVAAMRRIHAGVESGESRLRAMLDHVGEIGAIANSIADISSKTDMLALNLSIESARNATGGARGSSSVAEEVRRLAEQAAQAAHEVAGLVESVQLETQESIATIAQQGTDLASELTRVDAASEQLAAAKHDAVTTFTHLKAVGTASDGQIRLSTGLVSFVEEISQQSRESREQSEVAVWNAGSLATAVAQFDKLLNPLREIVLPTSSSEVPDNGTPDSETPPQKSAVMSNTCTSSCRVEC